MDIKSNKCMECKYILESYLAISYEEFSKDFEILSVSGDALTCSGKAECKKCKFLTDFTQECLIYEKLYLVKNS